MSWKDLLERGREIILATSSKNGRPNAVVVICEGIIDDKILINVCQMKTSLNNIKENNQVCVVTTGNGEYYRISGNAILHSSGKYFDIGIKSNDETYPVKHVLTIDAKHVFDLDKAKVIL
ncbi:MAG: pyridoxamine 5'-phosphate oxidase family protein [Nanoarchaeota archaeon]|nr:pyridoxamine 5'-phosphate oxidase family protein [Nanoarchaeota archaeon]